MYSPRFSQKKMLWNASFSIKIAKNHCSYITFSMKCLPNPINLSIFAATESATFPLKPANQGGSYITKYHGKCRIKDNRTHLHPTRTAGESFFYKYE